MLQEVLHGLLLIEEADDRLVHSRELLILVVSSRIMYGAAVKHEASSIAAGIFGDTLLVGETGDAHRQFARLLVGGKHRQCDHPTQQVGEIGHIGKVILGQQSTQVIYRHRYALHEVRLMLKVSAIAIGTQHLQCTEEHKVLQTLGKHLLIKRAIAPCRLQILLYQFAPHLGRKPCPCLPQERHQVILRRASPPTLKVDKPRLAIAYHDVARLEVTVHKRIGTLLQQHLGHTVKVIFEVFLLKLQSCSLEEAVFEIVQVPLYAPSVQFGRGVAMRKVKLLSRAPLHIGQQPHHLPQQLHVGLVIPAPLVRLGYQVKQRRIAQVLLQVTHAIGRYGIHLGYG